MNRLRGRNRGILLWKLDHRKEEREIQLPESIVVEKSTLVIAVYEL